MLVEKELEFDKNSLLIEHWAVMFSKFSWYDPKFPYPLNLEFPFLKYIIGVKKTSSLKYANISSNVSCMY